MARRTTTTPDDDFEEHIVDIDVREEMRTSFLEYAYSVIYSRALPDARDGLKPVQRRILYTMHDMGIRPDRGHVKSARVVGEVMGRLHPHGDGAIYDALVRMAQPWAMRIPLIDGHGNFGSPDDPPAAMRYSECRMAPAATPMTADIDEDTVDFKPNYDSRELEPVVLPAAFPQPAGERRQRDRGRDGDEHGPPQPGRGRPGTALPRRPPGCLPRRPHALHPRPRPADRRQDHRARRHPRRLRDGAWRVPDAGERPNRDGGPPAQGHRGDRDAVRRRHGAGRRADQDPRPVEEARRASRVSRTSPTPRRACISSSR